MSHYQKTKEVKITPKFRTAIKELSRWLANKKVPSEEYVNDIFTAIKSLKGTSNHKTCRYDTLKEHGDYCQIIKPGSKKCYVIYDIKRNDIVVKYIKPCSQAYNYDDV